jgi:hypothetical protein
MTPILSNLNTQTLSLLIVVCGLVIVCMGMWYVWSAQQQLQTDMLLLQAQYAQLSGVRSSSQGGGGTSSVQRVDASQAHSSGVGGPDGEASRTMTNHMTTTAMGNPANASVAAPLGQAFAEHPSVKHRSDATLTQQLVDDVGVDFDSDVSSDSASDYEDDEETDGDDEDDDSAKHTTGSCTADVNIPGTATSAVSAPAKGLDSSNETISPQDTRTPTAPPRVHDKPDIAHNTVSSSGTDAHETANIVNSLLSNIVTETIDQIMPASSAVSFLNINNESVDGFVIEGATVSAGSHATTVSVPLQEPCDATADIQEIVEVNYGACTKDISPTKDAQYDPHTAPSDEPTAATNDTTSLKPAHLPEGFEECQGDPKLLSQALYAKTVSELKQLCGTCEVGIKKGKGFKRKAELVDDLVQKVCA